MGYTLHCHRGHRTNHSNNTTKQPEILIQAYIFMNLIQRLLFILDAYIHQGNTREQGIKYMLTNVGVGRRQKNHAKSRGWKKK